MNYHSLRHNAAIELCKAGVDPVAAAMRLGHNVTLFLTLYAGHYDKPADLEAATKVASALESMK